MPIEKEKVWLHNITSYIFILFNLYNQCQLGLQRIYHLFLVFGHMVFMLYLQGLQPKQTSSSYIRPVLELQK